MLVFVISLGKNMRSLLPHEKIIAEDFALTPLEY